MSEILRGASDDPVVAAEALRSLITAPKPEETRLRARDLVLLLMERERRFLEAGADNDGVARSERRLRAYSTALRRIALNIAPATALRAALVEGE